MRSPKLSNPMANPPKMTLKLSQLRNVRSLAKKTLGSTRVGRAILLPVLWERSLIPIRSPSYADIESNGSYHTGGCLEEWLRRHGDD